MAKVVITFDNDLAANAFAMWAEEGDMLEQFNQTSHSTNLIKAGGGELSETDVTMDPSEYDVEHEVDIR